ncbi:Major facilitator superfamily domain general substrate transporter [Penicillium atrosanguineum]|uniref:Major facilitator superfamily domain general substrate transporter n=1 Tax=Penicillium atrosanguineum TaxID=1132637 RepID=A0A9W9PZE3_9EURO|nr:Major facilitator superfamily domain general substrate transporter [Penicillium atrosanguineum]KAJ5320745.1 Major facilitator superfamily domain general substrate transporter [Penicillium atrosanguineum]
MEEGTRVQASPTCEDGQQDGQQNNQSTIRQLWTHSWFQILLISFICFCCPGMYNALTGLGGSGQVDQTVAANANVALLSATAATALFVVGPIFDRVGPRVCLLLGGWTYPLYSGSLLCFNATANGAFVIAAGAILGIGASFIWVAQGAIMTTYVPESQKGRAIAIFWIIFNLGGGVGSLASFGSNFHSTSGTVSDGTYIALLVIMALGWLMGVFICPPSYVRVAQLEVKPQSEKNWRKTMSQAVGTITNWRVLCMLPLFFSANVFYSYQQNVVNGMTFNIRTRSLNGALYWMAQMVGGLVIGLILDMPGLNRRMRARVAWCFLFATGMGIWGGGYAFQKWFDRRMALGLKQDIDYTDNSVSVGPMFLYIFYGCYDAFWQSFCYWLVGASSNDPAKAAVLVGAYKTFQSAGGAMAWRINAIGKPAMTQFAMDWGLCMGALVLAIPAVLTVTLTSESDPDAVEGTEMRESDEKARVEMKD